MIIDGVLHWHVRLVFNENTHSMMNIKMSVDGIVYCSHCDAEAHHRRPRRRKFELMLQGRVMTTVNSTVK